jgi:ATP-dependent RNA helicase DDX49/DBP8
MVDPHSSFHVLTMSTLFGKQKRKRAQVPKVDDAPDEGISLNDSPALLESTIQKPELSTWAAFDDLGLSPPLVATCRQLGFKKPTPVQRSLIPFLLNEPKSHVLALASTGTGKTAAFVLPIIARLVLDPYGIYAVILTPTRELAKQIHQQVLALGSAYNVKSALVVGGLDAVRQSCDLDARPHICVATPGRLAELLRGPNPPQLKQLRFMVLDEADRLLAPNSGFERDVAELLLHCTTTTVNSKREQCQTLLFSATMTRSLESLEEMAGAGLGRLPLRKFVLGEDGVNESDVRRSTGSKKSKKAETKNNNDANDCKDTVNELVSTDSKVSDTVHEIVSSNTPNLPSGLKLEYIFMPSRVRDTYLLTAIRELMANGGRRGKDEDNRGWKASDDLHEQDSQKARSVIVFVNTCERAGFISSLLSNLGVDNVALHSVLSQNRRLAALGKFKSQQTRVLVATDVASRGLDIPTVDLVINAELPRNATAFVHRVGRTARAGRRGRAISLVAESDIGLVHAAENLSGRSMDKCRDVTDDMALKLLGPVAKAARLTKMKLMDIGFDELVQKFKERKASDRKERDRIERVLRSIEAKK